MSINLVEFINLRPFYLALQRKYNYCIELLPTIHFSRFSHLRFYCRLRFV